MTVAEASSDTGIVTAGISVARQVPRNTKITTSTTISVSISTFATLRIDSTMNTVKSRFTPMLMSAGMLGLAISSAARTRFDTSSTLAVEVGTMPRLTPGRPSERDSERSSSAASCTSATSPRRTR